MSPSSVLTFNTRRKSPRPLTLLVRVCLVLLALAYLFHAQITGARRWLDCVTLSPGEVDLPERGLAANVLAGIDWPLERLGYEKSRPCPFETSAQAGGPAGSGLSETSQAPADGAVAPDGSEPPPATGEAPVAEVGPMAASEETSGTLVGGAEPQSGFPLLPLAERATFPVSAPVEPLGGAYLSSAPWGRLAAADGPPAQGLEAGVTALAQGDLDWFQSVYLLARQVEPVLALCDEEGLTEAQRQAMDCDSPARAIAPSEDWLSYLVPEEGSVVFEAVPLPAPESRPPGLERRWRARLEGERVALLDLYDSPPSAILAATFGGAAVSDPAPPGSLYLASIAGLGRPEPAPAEHDPPTVKAGLPDTDVPSGCFSFGSPGGPKDVLACNAWPPNSRLLVTVAQPQAEPEGPPRLATRIARAVMTGP